MPSIEPRAAAPGDTLTISSDGFDSCEGYGEPRVYRFTLHQPGYAIVDAGTTSVATDGTFSATLVVPSDLVAGEATIEVSGSAYDDCPLAPSEASSCATYMATFQVTSTA